MTKPTGFFTCIQCQTLKHVDQFVPNSRIIRGHTSTCRACLKQRQLDNPRKKPIKLKPRRKKKHPKPITPNQNQHEPKKEQKPKPKLDPIHAIFSSHANQEPDQAETEIIKFTPKQLKLFTKQLKLEARDKEQKRLVELNESLGLRIVVSGKKRTKKDQDAIDEDELIDTLKALTAHVGQDDRTTPYEV